MDKLFGYFCNNGVANETQIAYVSWFVDQFPVGEFQGDERLMYQFLEFCVNLEVPPKAKYLDTWCKTEMRKILLRDKTKVAGCETMDFNDPVAFETACQISTEVLRDDFDVLINMGFHMEDFPVDASEFINTRKKTRLTEVLSTTFNILQDKEDSEEAAEYAAEYLNLLNDIYDPESLEDLTETRKEVDKSKLRFVTDFGLPGIDQDSDGIYTTQVVGIEAQPGTGKTRLAIGHPCYRAVTMYKQNVMFVSLEQDRAEVEAMFVARHVFTLFGIVINDAMIWKNKVPLDLQDKVEAARIDLFESGKYGKLVIEQETLVVETFVKWLKNKDRLKGPFDLIAIDYMGLFESEPGKYQRKLDDWKTISEAYKLYKRYCRRSRKAGIAIGQFNAGGIAAGKADKEITADMAQGGINVYRHTDYNVAMSMTDEMRAREQRRFSQPKVRSSTGFGTFIAATKLGVCVFKQLAKDTV